MNDILLLVQKCAHTFSFYDLDTKTALAIIVLPNFPHEFTVDVNERFAYVGIFGIETAWSRGHEGDHRIAEIVSSNARTRACSTCGRTTGRTGWRATATAGCTR